MKTLLSIILLASFFLIIPDANAQKGKDKKKKETKKKSSSDKNASRELKYEMQEYYYDIEKYERTRNEVAAAKKTADSLSKIAIELRKKEAESNEAMQKVHDEREKNQETIRKLEEELKASAEQKAVPEEGTFFSIQIGAFNQGALHEIFGKSAVEMKVETDATGIKKYMIGGYKVYEEAAAARKKLREMGAKDAWIVAYKNGSRVPMTDVRTTPIPEDELKQLEGTKK